MVDGITCYGVCCFVQYCRKKDVIYNYIEREKGEEREREREREERAERAKEI